MSTKNVGAPSLQKEHQRGFYSEPVEHSLHSPRTVSIGKSRVQAADTNCVDPQQVPLMGYKNYHQEFQMYPASREPVMVQPTTTANNTNNSAIMDLPNINTNLPPPLVPQQTASTMPPPTQECQESPLTTDSVSSAEILEFIQSIAKVMQQQLLFSSKMAEQGIV